MADTTNINDLPTMTGNNITLEMKEPRMPSMVSAAPTHSSTAANISPQMGQNRSPAMAQNMSPTLPHASINKIVNGIQTAADSNLTRLPSRDIPMMTHPHTQDKQSRPNYVPKSQQPGDYIKEHDSIQSMLQKGRKQNVKEDRLEYIYDELQTPVFVMILFLLFQLPFFQKILCRQLPALFAKDGHPRFAGYLFKTMLFGITFYFVQKGTKYLSRM